MRKPCPTICFFSGQTETGVTWNKENSESSERGYCWWFTGRSRSSAAIILRTCVCKATTGKNFQREDRASDRGRGSGASWFCWKFQLQVPGRSSVSTLEPRPSYPVHCCNLDKVWRQKQLLWISRHCFRWFEAWQNICCCVHQQSCQRPCEGETPKHNLSLDIFRWTKLAVQEQVHCPFSPFTSRSRS